MSDTAAILLAGGTGARFGGDRPKQFLPLLGKMVVLFSLEQLLSCPEIHEVVVVTEKKYQPHFKKYPNLIFALPGKRRQDSLFNGLQKVSHSIQWICVHDAARPFIQAPLISTLISEGKKVGAATLATQVASTIKEVDQKKFVSQTLKRELLWEIQTPQFASKELLLKGFHIAHEKNLTVTDDVSLIELLSHPVKIIPSSPSNLKITHPQDLSFAETLLKAQSI